MEKNIGTDLRQHIFKTKFINCCSKYPVKAEMSIYLTKGNYLIKQLKICQNYI